MNKPIISMFSPSRFMNSLLFIVALVFSFNTYAGDLDKAFKYLNTGDYPNARKYLVEAITDEPDNAAANYGMAKYYSLRDNKQYNLDSANIFIKKAAKKLPLKPDDKQTKKYLALGVRDYTIQTLQTDINQAAYIHSQQVNTVEGYQHFIDHYTEKGLLAQAANLRNQLAFIRANAKNDPAALDEFIKKYPNATEIKDAKEQYEKLLYEQTTAAQTYESYKKYLDTYPNGAYIKEAKKGYEDKLLEYFNNKHDLASYIEFDRKYKDHPARNTVQDSIYILATAMHTVEAYRNFVQNYKTNRNIIDAWEHLYVLYTADGTEEVYRRFAEDFADYPNKDRLYKDLEVAKMELKPIQQGDKWGYAIQPKPDSLTIVINGEYEEAFSFNNGLAAVRLKPCDDRCVYFYIDKNNRRAIAEDFGFAGDFHNGFAIVGTGNCEEDSCKYGMIDKLGRWYIQPLYDELNDPTEGLYLAGKNDKYGFIDQSGDEVVALKYDNALAFSEGIAAVALDTNWFFIDRAGKQLFLDYFHNVSMFKDSLCAATKDGSKWGYIDRTGVFVIPAIYEDAEDFEGGFAIVSKKEKDPKVKGLFISQRYKIDRTGKVIEKLTAPKAAKKAPSRKKGKR